jgi:hypothetical protein
VACPAAPTAGASAATVPLGPGKPRLMVFFATWLAGTSNLKAHLAAPNRYASAAVARHLPPPVDVDEAVTEPSATTAAMFLDGRGPLKYPVAMDETGRLADGCGVQDQRGGDRWEASQARRLDRSGLQSPRVLIGRY